MAFGGRRRGSGRYVATVLFVDIAASTERAAQIGDAAWRDLLGRYYGLLRRSLRRFGGREMDTAGDGLFAVFDGPADAIGCAFAVREDAAALGVSVRSGVHMGEVQSIQGKVGGIAVHIGARIAAAAAPGDVLVSGTVKDLVAGSRIRFEDRGETELKGVPGRWRLFAASPPAEGPTGQPIEPPAGRLRIEDWMRSAGRVLPKVRRPAILVGVAVVALVVVAGAALSLMARPPGPSPSSTPTLPAILVGADSVGRMDATGRVIATAPVGGLPDGIALAAGSLWVTNTTDGTVTRLDSATARPVQTIRVGASPSGIVSGFGAIWVANSGGRTVDRIDPTTNDVVATITVGISPTGLATDGKWVWVTNRLDGSISRIDPNSDSVTTFPVGQAPLGIATGPGAVWISDFDSGTVIRIDSQSGAASAPIHVGNGPAAVAATADAVWIVNTRDGTASLIDPKTGGVRAVIPVGAEPGGVAIASSAVWIAVASTSEMVRIDRGTGAVSRYPVGASPQGVTLDGDQPIFTARASEGSHRGGTLRIVSGAGAMPDSLDPAYAFSGLTLLTNDTLVAYKRVGGPEGTTLVPDLATSIPVPTDAGRSYTFQLAAGITYSTGDPIRASDVRRSIERAVAAAALGFGQGAFTGIVGVDQCKPSKTCDLSKGILADDQAGTITIRLVAPDPTFLYSLATTNAAILPGTTPPTESKVALPATGPYIFDLFSPNEVRLVRNTHFHEWSRAAQPEGYPDVIDWTAAPAGTDPSSLVESGVADVDADTIPPDRLASLGTRLPAQLHVASSLETFFEFMNTRIPPFDNVEVRRAVNLAVDRQAAIDAYGGPLQARITCQVVPPTFAGYEPYCPYTVAPDESGTWKGPDLSTARSLIDRAGVKGQAVTVYGLDLPGHQGVARYFTGLLTELGFKASTKLLSVDALFPPSGILSASSGVQMAGFWYLAPAPIASGFFAGIFTCPDFPNVPYQGYPQQFCDRGIDADVTKALALDQAGDRAGANVLWAQIDRKVTDLAPAVMAFNPTDVAFVSRRVGDFQHHPVWQILYDQLWVQ